MLKKPFVVYDIHGFLKLPCIVVRKTEDGYLMVHNTLTGRVDMAEISRASVGARWQRGTANPSMVARVLLKRAKHKSVRASPKAVRYLERLAPIEEEITTMPASAKKKLSAKTPDLDELKKAARSAPVRGIAAKNKAPTPIADDEGDEDEDEEDEAPIAKKGKGKPPVKSAPAKGGGRKGNPEALAKARAARAEGASKLRAMKIKVVNKKHTARSGTFRAQMLDDLFTCKTVGDFYDMNEKYDGGCVRWAERSGFIELR